jgi:hypothetical protein
MSARQQQVSAHTRPIISGSVAKFERDRRSSAIDGRTTRHQGYLTSQRMRKRVEEVFGWGKVVGTIRKVRVRGLPRVEGLFTFAMASYNLVRMRNIFAAAA